MLRNQSGFSVYTIISIVLFLMLVFVLALPNFFNLDKEQNVEDCINNMKTIWVATTDYVRDTKVDFNGDLEVLTKTRKLQDEKNYYMQTIPFCPETRGKTDNYIVFGKYVEDKIGDEIKHNYGVIVVCPSLESYPKHFIPKIFYENMDPTQLQNYMIDDLDYIDKQTGSDGSRKKEILMSYIEIWKTDNNAFNRRRADSNALKAQLFPDLFPNYTPLK